MKKLTCVLVSAVLVFSMLTGCGGAAAADKPFEGVTINALMEGHPSSDALKQLQGEFEAATGIKVNLEIIPYNELPQKAMLGFSQGSDQYDIIFNDMFIHGPGYVHNDFVLPLDGYLADPKLNAYWDKDDLVPAYRDAGVINGKTYGVPVYGESTFLMYRKDIFEKHGISLPKKLDELVETARTVQELEKDMFGITLRGQQGIHAVYVWCGFLWGYGGRWFDENGKLDLATPEAIRATEVYATLLNQYGPPGYSNFGWQENRLTFQQGKAAMTIDATVNGAFAEAPAESAIVGKVGYIPVPKGVEDGHGGPCSLAVHGLFINKFGKNPEAAFLFATWAVSKDVQTKAFAIEPNSGISSIGAMESPLFAEKYGAFKEGMLAALSVSNPDYLPSVPQSAEIIDHVGAALSQVLAGRKTAEQAMKDVNTLVNTEVLR